MLNFCVCFYIIINLKIITFLIFFFNDLKQFKSLKKFKHFLFKQRNPQKKKKKNTNEILGWILFEIKTYLRYYLISNISNNKFIYENKFSMICDTAINKNFDVNTWKKFIKY